jgi:putative peptidoglycan lipid II flippase
MMLSRTALVLNGLFAIRVAIGFGSYALMARTFGTSAEMDAFWVAVTPTLVGVNLVEACGIGAALTYVELLRREPDTVRRSETLGLLVIWLGLGTALGVASYLSADRLVQVLAPGMRGPLGAATVHLVQLTSVALAVGPVMYLCFGLLYAQGRFLHAAMLGLLPSLVLAAGQLLGPADIRYLAALFVGGYLVGALATIRSVGGDLSLWGVRPRYDRAGSFFHQFLPLVVGAAFLQLIFVRERALASHLEVGAISALSYALRIVSVVGGLVAAGFDATVTATVARQHVDGDVVGIRRHVRQSLVLVAILAVIPGVAVVLFAAPIVTLLFARGRFGAESIQLTAAAVVGYFGVYVWSSMGRVLVPAAIGRRRAGISLVISAAAFIGYVIWAPPLTDRWQVAGLALAASAAFALATVLYAADVARQ